MSLEQPDSLDTINQLEIRETKEKKFGGLLDLVDADGNVLGEKIEHARHDTAQGLHEIRRQRDSYTEESKKFSNLFVGIFNKERSPSALQDKAEQEERKARDLLSRGKSAIKDIEARHSIEKIYDDTIGEPLCALTAFAFKPDTGDGEKKREFDPVFYNNFFLRFNWNNARIFLNTPEFDYDILQSFRDYFSSTSSAGGRLPKQEKMATIIKSILLENLPTLDPTNNKNGKNYKILELFNGLLPFLTEEEITQFVPTIEKNVSDTNPIEQFAYPRERSLPILFEKGSQEFRDKLFADIDQKFKGNLYGMARSFFVGCPELERHSIEKLDEYLQSNFNISFTDVQEAWDFGDLEESHARVFRENNFYRNLEAMKTLEAKRPGAVKELLWRYGIKEFLRYPEELLLAQLEEENIQQPYGVLLYPRADHNGAFDQDRTLLGEFFKQTRGHCGVKIFENETTIDVARRFLGLDEKYGKQNKISFAVVAGHGNKEKIQFGDWWKGMSNLSKINIIEGRGIKRFKDFFVKDPSIVLFSCSTGTPEGIAKEMSATLNAKVLAPNESTHQQSLSITFDAKGKPTLDVKYSSSTQTMSYKEGKEVSLKQNKENS